MGWLRMTSPRIRGSAPTNSLRDLILEAPLAEAKRPQAGAGQIRSTRRRAANQTLPTGISREAEQY